MKKEKQKLSYKNLIKSKKLTIGILVITSLVSLFFFKKAAIFLIFVTVTGIITYFSKLYHIPIDVSPLFFLQIVVGRYYGLKLVLLFILLGYILPKLMAGRGMNWESYAFICVSLTATAFSTIFLKGLSLQIIGYIASVIQYIGGIFISMIAKPFYVAAVDGIANVTNNLLWFLIFSDLVIFLLG